MTTQADFDGEKYRTAAIHQKEWGTSMIDNLDLKGNEHILDLGCGDGSLTATLALRVPRGLVVGVDASSGMIGTAKRHEGPNLRFVQQNIERIDYHAEFDVIYSNAALHWIHDHSNLLARVAESLRSGGIIRFSFGGADNCPALIEVLQMATQHPDFASYFDAFQWPWWMPSVTEYESLMAHLSFEHVNIYLEKADRFFTDADALIRWIDQPCLVPFLGPVAPEARPCFRNQVVAGMIDRCRQPDGRYLERFRRLNVLARRTL